MVGECFSVPFKAQAEWRRVSSRLSTSTPLHLDAPSASAAVTTASNIKHLILCLAPAILYLRELLLCGNIFVVVS